MHYAQILVAQGSFTKSSIFDSQSVQLVNHFPMAGTRIIRITAVISENGEAERTALLE